MWVMGTEPGSSRGQEPVFLTVTSPTPLRYFIWNQILTRQGRGVYGAGITGQLSLSGAEVKVSLVPVFPSYSLFRLGPAALEKQILKTELSKAIEQTGLRDHMTP